MSSDNSEQIAEWNGALGERWVALEQENRSHATMVSVNKELARKIGLGPGVPAIFDTAAGRVEGRVVPDGTVQIGGIRVAGIRVGINSGGPAALLGQNFLNKIELRQSPERMTVRLADSH